MLLSVTFFTFICCSLTVVGSVSKLLTRIAPRVLVGKTFWSTAISIRQWVGNSCLPRLW
uniref:Uncharacterized protein n=1 Tax=Arundo donax TaxID=35708 RepID=A0A0A8YWS7_ARUDO